MKDGPDGPGRRAILDVGGMTCSNCSFAVERALKQLDWVETCQVDLINGKASVRHMGCAAELCDEVEAIGFEARLLEDFGESEASGARAWLQLVASPGDAKSCLELPGVLEVTRDGDELSVLYDPWRCGARQIVSSLRAANFQVEADHVARARDEGMPPGLPTALMLTLAVILISDVLPCYPRLDELLHRHLVPGLPCLTVILAVLATPVQLYCGCRFHLGAYHAIGTGVWDMNVLISLGTALCFSYSMMVVFFMIIASHVGVDCKAPPPSYFETPCFVITTILVGKHLEGWARSGASEALAQLLALRPQRCHLLPPGGCRAEEMPVQLLELGDVLQIFPGEVAPADGVMESAYGFAEFDESLLTGESKPMRKKKGDLIIGGSTCLSGRSEMRVEKLGSETMLSQIMALVQQAQLQRAPVQKVADAVAQRFVPAVVALGLMTWTAWYLLVYTLQVVSLDAILEGRKSSWPQLDKAFFVLEHGLNVLLVACPCALGLATPTAVMAATGAAARCGILVRSGAEPLEQGGRVAAVVLDKTGTLTQGKPTAVASAVVCPWASGGGWAQLLKAFQGSAGPQPGHLTTALPTSWLAPEGDLRLPKGSCVEREAMRAEAERAFWWALGSAELSSEHALAKELVEVASQKARAPLSKPLSFENLTGVGLQCVLPGELRVQVAAAQHLLSRGGPQSLVDWTEAQMSSGATVVALAVDGAVLAAVSLRDRLAPYARACVAQLEMLGVEVWMCTGDHQQAAEAVAKECGISRKHVVAQALPQDKVQLVQRLQEQKRQGGGAHVVMVGDGVNDAPALATADLGVAIGCGQNVTVDAADIVLVRSDLRDLLAFFELAKQTLNTIWFNFLWAFLFNICSLPLAAGVFWKYHVAINPQIACVLMLGSSLFVVGSSLLLKGFSPSELPLQGP